MAEYIPMQTSSRAGWRRTAVGAVLITLTIGFAIVAAIFVTLQQRFQERIYPNISIDQIPVGGLTRVEAEQVLRTRHNAFLQAPATLTFGERVWRPTLAELGVTFDIDSVIERAYQIGRDGDAAENIRTIAELRERGRALELPVSFEEQTVRQYVGRIASEINAAPIDARISLDGAVIRSSPAQSGREVLVAETAQELYGQLQSLQPVVTPIQIRDLAPQLTDAAVDTARREIERLLAGPVTLQTGEQQYIWPPEELAGLLKITRVPGATGDRITVAVDGEGILARLRQIADETEVRGTYPRVAWNGGDLRITRPGDPGSRIDESRARELVLAALNGQERTVELPWRATDPPVTEANLDQLGIKELVGVGTSDFAGSANYRVTNIVAGMRRLDGVLLAPGEEFSFTTTVGAINAANGFVEGAAIVQNRTQLEFGGGICQDSTTMFRAAFWAGLPITERWEHSFYINWYDKYGLGPNGNGPGLDAAIYTGVKDFKFVNDTNAWLLIEAVANPRTATAQVALYGTKPNREVRLTGYRVYNEIGAPAEPVFVPDPEQPPGTPRQSDRARGGMTIDLYRVVTENGIAREPELFRTRFRPWPNIFVINPADLGPDGRPIPTPADQAATPGPTPDGVTPSNQPPADPMPAYPPPEPQPAPEVGASSG